MGIKDGVPKFVNRPILDLKTDRLIQPNPRLDGRLAIEIDLHLQLLCKLPNDALKCAAAFPHREPPLHAAARGGRQQHSENQPAQPGSTIHTV